MAYDLGTYFIGDRVLFTVNTHNNKGNVADAISVPFYNVYKEETQNAVFSGTMAKLDDAGTTGFYSEIIGLTGSLTSPGIYSIYVQANVSNVIGSTSYKFILTTGSSTDINSTNILSRIGTPIALDGGTPTIAGMLTKFADDAGGTVFDATSDSNHAMAVSISASAPVAAVAVTGTATVGTVVSGNFSNTSIQNSVYWQIAPTGASALNASLTYAVGTGKLANTLRVIGRYQVSAPTASKFVSVEAFNYKTSSYDVISATSTRINGQTSSTDNTYTYALTVDHLSTAGAAIIRFVSSDVNATSNLYLDYVPFLYQTVGTTTDAIAQAVYLKMRNTVYDGGVYIDTVNGIAGTVIGDNGTAWNPVNTLADALTIANSLGVKRFYFKPDSEVTLNQSFANWRFIGRGIVHLGNQNISDAWFQDLEFVDGLSSGTDAIFQSCIMGSGSFYPVWFDKCALDGSVTMLSGGEYTFESCYDGSPSTSINPTFIFTPNALAGIRGWNGGLALNNMGATNYATIEGMGRVVINSNCSGGNVTIRGFFPAVTDQVVGGFAGTLTDTQRYGEDQNIHAVTDGWVSASGSSSAPTTTDIDNALSASHGTGSWASGGVVGTVDANVIEWRGAQPNVLQSGRVDSFVGVNNDKTGYSLADGSMAVFTGTVSSITNPVTVSGFVQVTGTVDANIVSSNNIDFTALQKTSLNSSTPASVGTVTGNINGTVQAVVDGWVQHSGTISGIPTTSDIDTALSSSHGTGSWASTIIGTVDANIVSSNNIDFTALQKTSLNASTPASVGTVTGNVNGSVNSVTNPVTIVGYVNVTGTVQAVVVGYVQVTGTVDANVEKWNTVDVVSGAVPAFVAGSAGGLATVDANNYIAGIQGTKNQLDDLNDIAAGSQMDLVNAPNATALNAIADAQLLRDWTAITGLVPNRSELNALRFLRNKWSVAAGILTVTKEDDLTAAWSSVVSSDATANPIIGSDPT